MKKMNLSWVAILTAMVLGACSGADRPKVPAPQPSSSVKSSCPDGNHPHAIDLGLPNGTKWACCNVGASEPTDCGGYYAWGETEEKAVYSPDTYAYYDSSATAYKDIGTDISGTSYDVAHVTWGGTWRMPTLDDIHKLTYDCDWQWTNEGGKPGMRVTGKNGNSIFLPAAGARYEDIHYRVGEFGGYWSATFCKSYVDQAYMLFFNDVGSYVSRFYRDAGYSVRPVSK